MEHAQNDTTHGTYEPWQGVLGKVAVVNCCDLPASVEEEIDWKQFEDYLLQRMTERTAMQRIRYAKKYCHVLYDKKEQCQLLQMTGDKRIHVMKAMAALARFTGHVPAWQEIKRRYNLTWSTGNEKLDAFQRFFDDGKSLDSMLQWVRDALKVLPAQMGEAIKWNTLTGLRPMESLQAIKLIKNPVAFKTYYDTDRQCLQHFKFPELFLRRTKTTYITIVDNDLLRIAHNAMSNPRYDRIRYACAATGGLEFHMAYCRKIYASWLRQSGIESEIIDLLQGRIPKSVFARHYFTPSLDCRDRVIRALVKLKQQINSAATTREEEP